MKLMNNKNLNLRKEVSIGMKMNWSMRKLKNLMKMVSLIMTRSRRKQSPLLLSIFSDWSRFSRLPISPILNKPVRPLAEKISTWLKFLRTKKAKRLSSLSLDHSRTSAKSISHVPSSITQIIRLITLSSLTTWLLLTA